MIGFTCSASGYWHSAYATRGEEIVIHQQTVEEVLAKEAWDEEILIAEAFDEQVLVPGAWDEQVIDHNECSCGATV